MNLHPLEISGKRSETVTNKSIINQIFRDRTDKNKNKPKLNYDEQELHEEDSNSNNEVLDSLVSLSDQFMNTYFNSKNIINLIIKWKWHFIIVLAIAIISSAVFSGPAFIKPKFKSYAVIYPSNLIPYSSETPTEQMLQLFESEDISLSIIRKFNLADHYAIDTNNTINKAALQNEYKSNVIVRKTEFESIIIEVYDTDPVIACDIVKEVIILMNLKARQLQREKTAEVVRIYKDQLENKQMQIDSIQEVMAHMRAEYQILDYKIQVEEYTKGYVKSITTGKGQSVEINRMLKNLEEFGGKYAVLDVVLKNLTISYSEIKIEYDKTLSDLTKELTYTNVVTNPHPAYKKSYPIRWLIVLISTCSTMLIMLICVSAIERYKQKQIKVTEA